MDRFIFYRVSRLYKLPTTIKESQNIVKDLGIEHCEISAYGSPEGKIILKYDFCGVTAYGGDVVEQYSSNEFSQPLSHKDLVCKMHESENILKGKRMVHEKWSKIFGVWKSLI